MRIFFSAIILLFLSQVGMSQPCGNSGFGVCTTTLDPIFPPYGFQPSNSNQIPCATRGVAYSQVVQLVFPTGFTPMGSSSVYGVNSWEIDSIQNLPCGLCWATNQGSNFFFPQTDVACIKFSGTTYDVPGQYKLRIKFSVNASTGISYSNQHGDHFEWEIYLRVVDQGSFCPNVNTSQPSLATSASGSISTPTISPSGPVTLCQGGSTILTANSGYAAYLWSNGATTQSITVTQAGNYTVKVFGNCDDATSSGVQVLVAQGNALLAVPASPDTFASGEV